MLSDKYQKLIDVISSFGEVAIAYSGGVDSTLLSYAACESLGPQNVLLLHAASPLLSRGVTEAAELIIKKQFSPDIGFITLSVNPLLEQRFLANSRERCYVCKKMIYSSMLEEIGNRGIRTLMDGTNCDDMGEERPGHQAIFELGVVKPLVEAGLHKHEIREAARTLGLTNAELPSNSCLATRIECDTTIEEGILHAIDEMEIFLTSHGFSGCRVRPRQHTVILEIRETHIQLLLEDKQRSKIIRYFNDRGFDSVMLNLKGRA